jgi:hypothetical protein
MTFCLRHSLTLLLAFYPAPPLSAYRASPPTHFPFLVVCLSPPHRLLNALHDSILRKPRHGQTATNTTFYDKEFATTTPSAQRTPQVRARMQPPKSISRIEGEAAKCITAIRDTYHDHGDAEQQTISALDNTRDEMEDEMSNEEQAEPESHASADSESGMIEYSEGKSENAVTFDHDCNDSEGDEPNNDGEEPKANVDDQDDSAASSAEATTLLHEHRDDPASNLRASEMPPNQSATASESSQTHSDTANASADATDSSEEQQHSSRSSVHSGDLVQDTLGEDHVTGDPWQEGETPPLDLNYEALKHMASTCMSHGNCIDITTLRRGGFHEIRVLHFEDGWSCIARFTRDYEMLCKTESELATIEYVQKHTTIPVPQIYFVNHNENHVVGAPFVLMERMEGQPLCKIWAGLTLEHKKGVIGQLAHMLGQLAELKFDSIGSLKADGTLGPLLNITEPEDAMSEAPFKSSIGYFSAFLKEDNPARASAAKEHYRAIQEELKCFMDDNAENPTLNAPFRLIHNDLDSQNILVTQEDKTLPPKISGIIDWDWSYTGPLYYLCEYPHDICDWDDSPENYADNKILRKHLVATMIDHFPENSPERKHIKQCFREKSYILNYFQSLFMTRVWPESMQGSLVEQYLKKMRGEGALWGRLPYSGTFDWGRDSDLSDSDLEDEESQSEDVSIYDEDSDDSDEEESSVELVDEADTSPCTNADEDSGCEKA